MSKSSPALRTPLGKVRGLGAAKSGTQHFWRQRVTAVALIPLTVWFVASIAAYAGAPYGAVVDFLANPINAVLMLLLTSTGIYHLVLGLQVVIEDYIPAHGPRIFLLLAVRALGVAVALACALAVLKLAL